jgi:PIN domain nuclease of toxin-antitoxin system
MTFIIDTQVLIWSLENNPRLSPKVQNLLLDGNNSLVVSIASLWEMAIKINLNKLQLAHSLTEIIHRLPEIEISILPILTNHILELEKLDLHHRDPFDRIIIAQAIAENLEIISCDEEFAKYPIVVNW